MRDAKETFVMSSIGETLQTADEELLCEAGSVRRRLEEDAQAGECAGERCVPSFLLHLTLSDGKLARQYTDSESTLAPTL